MRPPTVVRCGKAEPRVVSREGVVLVDIQVGAGTNRGEIRPALQYDAPNSQAEQCRVRNVETRNRHAADMIVKSLKGH